MKMHVGNMSSRSLLVRLLKMADIPVTGEIDIVIRIDGKFVDLLNPICSLSEEFIRLEDSNSRLKTLAKKQLARNLSQVVLSTSKKMCPWGRTTLGTSHEKNKKGVK